jgi:hypothetical protein
VDDGGGGVESGELSAGEADGVGSGVLLEPLQAPGAWDGHDPGPLGEEPRESDLRWRGFVLGGDLATRSACLQARAEFLAALVARR